MKKYLFISLLLFQIQAFSQKAGLVIVAKPSSSYLKVEGKNLKIRSLNYFEPGLINYKLWYPHYKMITDTVRVADNKIKVLKKKLEYTDEYLNYRKERHEQLRPMNRSLVTSSILIFMYEVNRIRLNNAEKKTNESYGYYYESFAIGDVEKFKSEYETSLKKYNTTRIINNVLGIACLVVIPSTLIYSTVYYKKRHTSFVEKPNPEFSFTPRIGIDNFGNVTSTLQFNF